MPLQLSYASSTLTTPALGPIKGNTFIQYLLVFKFVYYVRVCVYIWGTLSTLFYLAFTLYNLPIGIYQQRFGNSYKFMVAAIAPAGISSSLFSPLSG